MKLKVNESGVLSNLQRTFSNTNTWLQELLQNCRRSGATEIEISYDGGSIIIKDNGVGIQDWDSLLTIGQSGWNPESNENPFGMGFLAAIFASTDGYVQSKGKFINFHSDKLLAGETLEIKDGNNETGTSVTLNLKKSIDTKEIEKAVKAFPIHVTLNGEPLARPYSIENCTLHIPGAGWTVPEALDGSAPYFKMYYQCICVEKEIYPSQAVPLHLDQDLFEARMPDRDKLINHSQCLEAVNKALLTAFVKNMKKRIGNNEVRFIKENWEYVRSWRAQSAFSFLCYKEYTVLYVTDVPRRRATHEELKWVHWVNTEKQILRKDTGGYCIDDYLDDEDYWAFLTYCLEADKPFFLNDECPSGATEVDEDTVKIEFSGENKDFIAITNDIELTVAGDTVKCHTPFYNKGILYWPKETPQHMTYDVIQQEDNDFYDYDTEMFDEHECSRLSHELQAELKFRLSGDSMEYLQQFLEANTTIPKQFNGKSYTVEINHGRIMSVKEV